MGEEVFGGVRGRAGDFVINSIWTYDFEAGEEAEMADVLGGDREIQAQGGGADGAVAKAEVVGEMEAREVMEGGLGIDFVWVNERELAKEFEQPFLFASVARAGEHFCGDLRVGVGFARKQ